MYFYLGTLERYCVDMLTGVTILLALGKLIEATKADNSRWEGQPTGLRPARSAV